MKRFVHMDGYHCEVHSDTRALQIICEQCEKRIPEGYRLRRETATEHKERRK
jgi:hypothetical protein